MSYSAIENFRAGLDTRRSMWTSVPGCLLRCENAHINQGGEIEKRFALYPNGSTLAQNNKYGFESTSVGLTVFGSAIVPFAGNLNTVPQQQLNYQQLNVPYDNPAAPTWPMTQVVFSNNFNGNAFVGAKFNQPDGNPDPTTYLFYNGVVIGPSYWGRIAWGRTAINTIASDLAAMITAAIPATALTSAVAVGNNITVTMKPGSVIVSGSITNIGSGTGTIIVANGGANVCTFTVGGVWAVGDTFRLLIATNTPAQWTIGYGDLGGLQPTFGIAFSGRQFLAAGTSFLGSANEAPTQWESVQNADAFTIGLLTNYGSQDAVVALAPYQGKLAVFMRQQIQVWNINAAVINITLSQVLPNVGSLSALGVQPLGDWDILFPHDSGLRSMRVRDTTLNAYTTDLGSPVDKLVLAKLTAATAAQKQGFVGLIEPNTNRYWLYMETGTGPTLDRTTFVLSYFPTAKVVAWSTYKLTIPGGWGFYYNLGEANPYLEVVPQKFVTFNGAVYLRAWLVAPGSTNFVADTILYYGIPSTSGQGFAPHIAADGVSIYDATVATVQSPWLTRRQPATKMLATGIDFAVSGHWYPFLGVDPKSGKLEQCSSVSINAPTFDDGNITFQGRGTHFSFMMQTDFAFSESCVLSDFTLHLEKADEY